VADDDLDLPPCAIAVAFAAARAFRLVLAQPSLCPAPGVFSPYEHLYRYGARPGAAKLTADQAREAAVDAATRGGAALAWAGPATVDPGAALAAPARAGGAPTAVRLVNFVEVMAPIFEMSFWREVAVPSLWQSYYGTGMDSAWPRLLQSPAAAIGVVDAACMRHYAKPRGAPALLYALPTPHGSNRAEEAATWALYGVRRNQGWAAPHVHHGVTWRDVAAAAAAGGHHGNGTAPATPAASSSGARGPAGRAAAGGVVFGGGGVRAVQGAGLLCVVLVAAGVGAGAGWARARVSRPPPPPSDLYASLPRTRSEARLRGAAAAWHAPPRGRSPTRRH
jgi:hypothetical protein